MLRQLFTRNISGCFRNALVPFNILTMLE